MNNLLTMKNIKEIKFTRVGADLFSISVEADIEKDGDLLENSVFESKLCKIDSVLELKSDREYADIVLEDNSLIKRECFTVPINIQLLNDGHELFKFYPLKKK